MMIAERWLGASRLIAVAVMVCVVAPCPAAHPVPESERWATITHPGNDPYAHTRFPGDAVRFIGRVDCEYQISRTEVTGEEWFEFVQAYGPYVNSEHARSSEFTSFYIVPREDIPGVITYEMAEAARNLPVEVGWRFAARYVNWLHNAKALAPDAFENGVYNTGTFGEGPDGITDQLHRAPDAVYWLPSRDEWTKAMYFDLDRHGAGQPGYWFYPHGSDSPPVTGVPGAAQTSAGMFWPGAIPEVAAYFDVQSPWGLWDGSGGVREWSDDPVVDIDTGEQYGRYVMGTVAGPNPPATRDRIGAEFGTSPQSHMGIRVARAIPGPSGTIFVITAYCFTTRRRRSPA